MKVLSSGITLSFLLFKKITHVRRTDWKEACVWIERSSRRDGAEASLELMVASGGELSKISSAWNQYGRLWLLLFFRKRSVVAIGMLEVVQQII